MSQRFNSYPMWAHYAEQHKGCCLEFNFSRFNKSSYNWKECFPFVFVGKIAYSEKLPTLNATEKVIPHEKGSVYMTKFKHWEYEEEWRAVMYDRTYKPNKELFDFKCASFKKDIKKDMKGRGAYKIERNFLSGIILGNEMRDSDKKTIIAAAKICKISNKSISLFHIFSKFRKISISHTFLLICYNCNMSDLSASRLIISQCFAPQQGGIETLMLGLARALCDAKQQTTVYADGGRAEVQYDIKAAEQFVTKRIGAGNPGDEDAKHGCPLNL